MSGSGAGADVKAWNKYPQLRCFYNKLYVAELFDHQSGPAGLQVPKADKYVVRPIINMAGMSANARIIYIDKDESFMKVPPGYFWCERFHGRHLSIDYVKENDEWIQINAYEGFNYEDDLSRFSLWKRVEDRVDIPKEFNIIKESGLDKLNFECIKNIKTADVKIFEVHLRNGFDHMMEWKYIIPVFKGDPTRKEGYRFIEGFSDGWGQLLYPRIGYLVK